MWPCEPVSVGEVGEGAGDGRRVEAWLKGRKWMFVRQAGPWAQLPTTNGSGSSSALRLLFLGTPL